MRGPFRTRQNTEWGAYTDRHNSISRHIHHFHCIFSTTFGFFSEVLWCLRRSQCCTWSISRKLFHSNLLEHNSNMTIPVLQTFGYHGSTANVSLFEAFSRRWRSLGTHQRFFLQLGIPWCPWLYIVYHSWFVSPPPLILKGTNFDAILSGLWANYDDHRHTQS